MARWKEIARFSVVDLSDPSKHLGIVQSGFYWFVPLDGDQLPEGVPEDHKIRLVGPFPTREAARDAAQHWMAEMLSAPASNDNLIKDAA